MRKVVMLENRGYTDIMPTDMGYEDCEPRHTFGPALRKYFLIHFVTDGEGSFKTARGEYKLSAGQAFLIKPGEVTVYSADSRNPWTYFWIGFSGNEAKRLLSLPDVFYYDPSTVRDIEEAIESAGGREELASAAVFRMLASLETGSGVTDYPTKVEHYINLHYMENVTISGIAESLGLNRKYLARIFKESRGISMQECLISKRLHEAKKLLLSGYGASESAYMVGYSDPFGFSKAFKNKYGVPPSAMKKQ
jgi:AraC-like DNA-binding protein